MTLARLKELEQAATAGPWQVDSRTIDQVIEHKNVPGVWGVFPGAEIVVNGNGYDDYETACGVTREEDSNLIVALRNNAAALIAVAEAAKIILDRTIKSQPVLHSVWERLYDALARVEGGE